MPGLRRHQVMNRQVAAPTGEGIGGTALVTATGTGALVLASGVPSNNAPLPSTNLFTITVLSSDTSAPTPTPSDSPSSSSDSTTQQASHHSDLPISTVIAACVGAFVGLAILIVLFWLWYKRSSSKARARQARSRADSRNARGEVDQRRARGRSWNKLDDDTDRWEGQKVEMKEKDKGSSQRDDDEKNFPMFKKTNSVRTTRTAKALEEHGFDLPAFEFSKYHPSLAQELALEQPAKPYAQRQESGVSWDGETIADESFLNMRTSGAMSPNIAKMTPPASIAAVHKWESAEVLTMDDTASTSQAENPFAEPSVERRTSRANPFFSASDLRHTQSVRSARSRSNSYGGGGGGHSRNTSRASRVTTRSRARSDAAEDVDPFDEATPLPRFRGHVQTDSTATTSSGGISEHAMQSLIAALDLTPEQVQERIRVASMQPSMSSRYSTIADSVTGDAETVRGIAVGPLTPIEP